MIRVVDHTSAAFGAFSFLASFEKNDLVAVSGDSAFSFLGLRCAGPLMFVRISSSSGLSRWQGTVVDLEDFFSPLSWWCWSHE